MNAKEYRELAKADGRTYGPITDGECEDIREAEEFVRDFPLDDRRFGVAAPVNTPNAAAARDLLKANGYRWVKGGEESLGRWVKPGYWAVAAIRDRATTIYIYRDGTPIALSATESHPAESLGLAR